MTAPRFIHPRDEPGTFLTVCDGGGTGKWGVGFYDLDAAGLPDWGSLDREPAEFRTADDAIAASRQARAELNRFLDSRKERA